MNSYHKILLLLILIPLYTPCLAQSSEVIYGQVLAENNQPVPGAEIQFKKGLATSGTKADGRFFIVLRYPSDTLVVTHLGYQTYTRVIRLGGENPIHIKLVPSLVELKDVVVSNGYQDIPKERATGSFYKLDNRLLSQRVGPDLLGRLEGLTSSLLIDNRDPNQQTIQIRGLSTLNYASASPLIVLDNFPYAGDINNINPNDIESVTVLKDAAASSIWGARAGNGVIVINTKRAKAGQPLRVSINSNVSVSARPNLFTGSQLSVNSAIDLENYLFGQGKYDAAFNDRTQPGIPAVAEILQQQKLGQLTSAQADAQINQLRNNDVRQDMSKYLYRPTVNQQYYLNLTGAGSNVRYLVSAGYDKGLSNLRGNDNERFTFRSNNAIDLTKRWQLQTDILLTKSTAHNNSPGSYGGFRTGDFGISPYAKLVNSDGSPAAIDINYRSAYTDTAGRGKLLDWKYRPVQELANNDNGSTSTDVLLNLGTSYKVFKWLNADVKYQYQQSWVNNHNLYNTDTFYARDYINRFTQISGNTITYAVPNGGILRETETVNKQQSVRGQLTVNHSWTENHQLSALIGGEVRQSESNAQSGVTYGYDPNTLTTVPVDYTRQYPIYDGLFSNSYILNNDLFKKYLNRFVSVFANAAYTFMQKYTLSGSVRRDASNLFGISTNQKWVPLWSAGALWKIDQEKFYKVAWMPQLALRLSYGVSGNLSPNATALTRIQYFSASGSPLNLPYVGLSSPPNPHLRWEQVRTWNAAADFSALDGRITGSVDVYRKNSADLINSVLLDPTVGFSTADQNSASIRSKGVDVVLNTLNVNGGLKWRSTILFNYINYKITKNLNPPAPEGFVSDGTIILPLLNFNPYIIVSYKWAGLDPQNGDPMGYVGGVKSKDYEAITQNALNQQVVSGSALPPLFGTLRNTFEWQQFSLAFNLTYKFNYYFRRPSLNYTDLLTTGKGYAEYDSRWQKPGDESHTNVPSLVYPANALRDQFYNYADINVEKADHVKLNEVYLSYELVPRVKILSLKSIQFYGYASQLNWMLWKANKSGLDPDFLYNVKLPATFSAGIKANL